MDEDTLIVEDMTIMEKSPLFGKKISFNGDSICQGAGHPGGYGKIIADRCGMIYQNVGVGGGTVAAEQFTKTGVKRHWISRTVCKMDGDADYAIVEGGVNDASLFGDYGSPLLGTITEGFNKELDDTTFIGAFESMLRQLVTKFRGKKIGYIAVHRMTGRYTPEFREDENFYLAAKRCCEKWGVPFLDLTNEVPPFAFFRPEGDPRLYELRKRFTKDGDGWHPNEDGYLRYYCDKIESWLKTL